MLRRRASPAPYCSQSNRPNQRLETSPAVTYTELTAQDPKAAAPFVIAKSKRSMSAG
jgi:hypothetical protein